MVATFNFTAPKYFNKFKEYGDFKVPDGGYDAHRWSISINPKNRGNPKLFGKSDFKNLVSHLT